MCALIFLPHALLTIAFALQPLPTEVWPSADPTAIRFHSYNMKVAMESTRPSHIVAVLPAVFSFVAFINRHRRRLIVSFVLLMHALGFFTSIRAILETRTSKGAIAWAISLNTVPYVAVPAYWVFGQSKFSDYEVVRRKDILASPARSFPLLISNSCALQNLSFAIIFAGQVERQNRADKLLDGLMK